MATRNDRQILSASDDLAKMTKQVLAKHAPDGHEVDVEPILSIIEDIFRCATAIPSNIDGVPNGTHGHMDELHDNKRLAAFSGKLEALSDIIHKIYCEISCKCSGGEYALATTTALFNTLSSYSWDAKMVLSLAAFAVKYGEYWLVAQLCAENSLAMSVAVLKQLHHIPAHYDDLKPQFDELNKLIKAMLELTKSIVNLKQLRTKYLSPEGQAKFNEAHFQAAYWTFQSIVACNSRTLSPTGLRPEDPAPTTEDMELSTLAHKVSHTVERLKKQSESWKQEIEKNMQDEEYQKLKELLNKKNKDVMEVLRALIYAKDLVNGETKTTDPIDVLNKKHVLLLISSLDDLSTEEILVLKQVYKELKASKECRIVWLPMVDKVDWQHKFENLQKEMPWYTVQDPTMIRPAVIKYIKKVWKFSKKAILVAVDPQGRILNQNAFHMLQMWETSAFPFTAEREAALWKESSWNELFFGRIDDTILKWMKEDRLICLYGGEDEAWIREFTKSAKGVASNLKIKFGMAYVGKKNAKKSGAISSLIRSIITEDDSSHIPKDTNAMWSFWARLESIFYSKLPGMSPENNTIMQKAVELFSLDSSDQGWTIFWGGKTQEIARAKGDVASDCMKYLLEWQNDASPQDIIKGLNKNPQLNSNGKHCIYFAIPYVSGEIPWGVPCADCGQEMEKFFMYRCCTE